MRNGRQINRKTWSGVFRFQTILMLFILSMSTHVFSQTVISSLSELKSHLGDSGGNFKMTPGTYYFNKSNTGPGKLFGDESILMFTGSNNTFDFTGVKFEFHNDALSEFSDWVVEFWPVGDNNIYLNLTMEDIGMETPGRGAEAIHLDGADNRIEGFHITVRGSNPYGYGDIFGKGGGSVIGHQKHPGVLVRGERNHLLNDTVIMRAYGHGIFMQGSQDALIEGCYVEGELRTVGEVLEEKGTNSAADNVDFLTVWGYYLTELQHDYRFSLQEDGIRCYTTGTNYGDTESRSTTGTQIKNCTVVKMRSGVTIGWDYTNKVVENCKVLACETGYWFGSKTVATGCSGDASVGPLISEDVSRSNSTIELTLLDNYVEKIGNTPYIYYAGNDHNLTLYDGTTCFNSDIVLQVGGKRQAHRWLEGSGEEPLNKSATNLTFTNNTKYPVVLESNASNNTIYSCGTVTNKGTGNSITQLTDCSYTITCSNTADNLQAECYDDMSGIQVEDIGDKNERAVGNIEAADWISFNNIDLTNIVSVQAIAGTDKDGGSIEIREGSFDGNLLGTLPVSNTGSFSTYQESFGNLDLTVDGLVDIYFVFTGGSGYLFNLDKISFIKDSCSEASYDAFLPISAEDFCTSSGIVVEDRSALNQVVSDLSDGDYLRFSNVHFGNEEIYNAVRIFASSDSEGGTIEVRSGSVDGALLMTVNIAGTGSWDEYKTFIGNAASDITGTHDIYLVFKGTGDQLMKVDNFYFLNDQCAGRSYEAYSQIEAEDFCEMNGVEILGGSYLGNIQDGDWIRFSNVNFTSIAPLSVKLNIASVSGGYMNVMLDDPRGGTLVATITAPGTGGWTSWKDFLLAMNQEVTGIHDVYIYFGGGTNLNWIQFTDIFVKGQTNPYERFEAEINDGEKGTVASSTTDVDGINELGNLEDGDYIMFSALNLGDADSIYARVASAVDGGIIEVRTGSANGKIISFIDVPNTGSSDTWQTVSTKLDNVEGENDVYFVFRGEGSDLFKLNWLQFTRYGNSFPRLEAEDNDSSYGNFLTGATTDAEDDGLGSILRFTYPGNWVQFADVNLTGAKSVNARYCTSYKDAFIEVRIDAPDGELIGNIELGNTGSFSDWGTASGSISSVSGVHDVYFVYQTETSSVVCGSNWFQFSGLSLPETIDPTLRIEAEDYDRASGTIPTATSDVDGESELGSIKPGDWILFKNIDLTDLKSIDVRIANPNDGSRIELWTGSYTGSLLAYIKLPNTGSSTNWQTVNANLYSGIVGKQNVYVVFKGSASDNLLNINWLQFKGESSGLAPNRLGQDIQIYPNPLDDYMKIKNANGSRVKVFNITGVQYASGFIDSDEFYMNTNQLSTGIYKVIIIDKNGYSYSFKVVKL